LGKSAGSIFPLCRDRPAAIDHDLQRTRRMRQRVRQCVVILTLCAGFVGPVAADEKAGAARAGDGTPATNAPLALADFEQLALRSNPTLVQAAANVEAARGRAVQSGLYPNPTVGYQGDRIGAAGTAGEMQGLFIDQTVVTAGKLRLNRAKFGQEVCQAEAQALAQQYRVLNGVGVRFYQLLAMQRQIDVQANLLAVADEAVNTTEQLVNVGAANKADLLQARIEARQERVAWTNARTQYTAAWQQFAAFLGDPGLPVAAVDGDLEKPGAVPDFDGALAHLLEASPEMLVARAEVRRSEFGLKREQVERIPNVQVQVANGYDFETRNDVTSVSIGVRLPVFDRNQGNIRTAQAQLAYSQADLGRVELSLRQRLVRAYARYRTASESAETYRKSTVPEAKEAYELYLDSFRRGRAAWPQVLVAQRTYFQMSVEYYQALQQLRRAEVAILGLVLVDGLDDLPDPINPRQGRSVGGD
jgi:cobalt-zinc-cadmium efflux system outer membrane protein